MAQTTGAFSGKNFDIEVRLAGTGSWIDISGSTNSIQEVRQNRMTGEIYTAEGDTALITFGKREPMDIEVRVVYTETSGEAFQTVRPWFETDGGVAIDLRWAPRGKGASGRTVYNALNAPLTAFSYGTYDAGDANPVMSMFRIRAPILVTTTTDSSTGLGS